MKDSQGKRYRLPKGSDVFSLPRPPDGAAASARSSPSGT